MSLEQPFATGVECCCLSLIKSDASSQLWTFYELSLSEALHCSVTRVPALSCGSLSNAVHRSRTPKCDHHKADIFLSGAIGYAILLPQPRCDASFCVAIVFDPPPVDIDIAVVWYITSGQSLPLLMCH